MESAGLFDALRRRRLPSALSFAAGLLLLSAIPGHADEPVLARVVRLDSAAGTLVLQVEGETSNREIGLSGDLPAGVEPGALVRMWPGTPGDTGSAPTAARIAPFGINRFDRDRTGVRGRLSRGSGRGAAMGGGRGGR